MGFKASKKEFLSLIQDAYPIVPLKSTLQILSNFRIWFDGERVHVVATDLDHSIVVTSTATGDAPFDVTVNARKLFEITKELPEGDVTIEVDESVFHIESAKGFSCKIASADARDFPGFPEVEAKQKFTTSVGNLADMVTKSSFAVSRDESRACLCGILWEVDPTHHAMIGTDGHRLGNCVVHEDTGVVERASAIVSPKSLLHLVRVIGGAGADRRIDVTIGEKYVTFATERMQLFSKLIEGPYPDYRKVIPANNPRSALIERVALMEAVRRVSVLSNQKTNLIKFSFRPGEVELRVINREIGAEAKEVLPAQYAMEEHMIGFNAQYLSEILSIIKSKQVRMDMNTQISACLLFPNEEGEAQKRSEDLFLIMPLRIVEEL